VHRHGIPALKVQDSTYQCLSLRCDAYWTGAGIGIYRFEAEKAIAIWS